MLLAHDTAMAMLAAMDKHAVTAGLKLTDSSVRKRALWLVATAMSWAACIELVCIESVHAMCCQRD